MAVAAFWDTEKSRNARCWGTRRNCLQASHWNSQNVHLHHSRL